MRARRVVFAVGAGAAAALTACTAILGLPDPVVDSTYGTDAWVPRPDGALPDGGPLPDGSLPDGADGSVPTDAGPCFGGGRSDAGLCKPVPLAILTDPRLLATDDTYVYVADMATNVARIDPNAPDGGVAYLTQAETQVNGLHAGGGFVYFTNGSGSAANVSRCSIQGCAMGRKNYFVDAGARNPYGVTTDPTSVYFSSNQGAGPTTGGLYRFPLDGGTLMQSFQTNVPTKLVWHTGDLFWMGALGAGVNSCPAGACTNSGIPTSSVVVDFAVAQQFVYYVEMGGVYQQTRGQMQYVKIADVADAKAIGVGGGYVYWLTAAELQRCPVGCPNTNQIQTIATNLSQGKALAVGSDSAYFVTFGDKTIWRVGHQ